MARSRESRSAGSRRASAGTPAEMASAEAAYSGGEPQGGEPPAGSWAVEATGPVRHGLVGGGGPRPEITRGAAAVPQPERAAGPQEIPPFDEARAIPAEVVSYGGEDRWRIARLEAALPQAALFDDRYRIQNTLGYPQRCICQLHMTFWADLRQEWKYFVGTGWIIARRAVATVGHNLLFATRDAYRYGIRPGAWASRVEVIPGRNGDADPPYGNFTAGTENLYVSNGWQASGQQGADYGGIVLNEDLPRGRVFGFDWELANLPHDEHHRPRVEGYPGEKSGQMWGDDTPGLDTPTDLQLRYHFYTTGGQSGSPVYYIHPDHDGLAVGVGIHAYGSPSFNLATRITHEVYAELLELRNMGGGVWD
jgi:V8-like Glu-specific endopeptidase